MDLNALYTALKPFLEACALVGSVTAVIAVWVGKAKAPNAEQNKRLDDLTKRVEALEITEKAHDAGLTVIHTALFALLSHACDGNDIALCKSAREELQKYLINK